MKDDDELGVANTLSEFVEVKASAYEISTNRIILNEKGT